MPALFLHFRVTDIKGETLVVLALKQQDEDLGRSAEHPSEEAADDQPSYLQINQELEKRGNDIRDIQDDELVRVLKTGWKTKRFSSLYLPPLQLTIALFQWTLFFQEPVSSPYETSSGGKSHKGQSGFGLLKITEDQNCGEGFLKCKDEKMCYM